MGGASGVTGGKSGSTGPTTTGSIGLLTLGSTDMMSGTGLASSSGIYIGGPQQIQRGQPAIFLAQNSKKEK